MNRPLASAAAAALCALAAAGCGVGEGETVGEAELTVTRDYGAELMLRETVEVSESDTVLRALDRSADIETRFGGGFVQSIDGLSAEERDGRRIDWFYFVNGVESSIGAADYELSDGDRVWWDHRDWSTAMRVPAVVGSWPEPFVSDHGGEEWSVGVFCPGGPGAAAEALCAEIDSALGEHGVDTSSEGAQSEGPDGEARILVGPWEAISEDPDAALLARGPDRSGVFATFSGVEPSVGLALLDARGRVAETLGQGAGLVAALRPDEGPPTWVVTGTDAAGVAAAADLITQGDGGALADRYAIATVSNGPEFEVPVP